MLEADQRLKLAEAIYLVRGTLMRKELVTTNKLDNAIAPAAYIGE
ncbi:MAG: hypothetical protein RL126_328, partial [Actinomycetota bacterium]